MRFALRFPLVVDSAQQANNEDLVAGLNQVAQFVFAGAGAPTFTPSGVALYFRTDFAANAAVYVYDGSWKSVT